MGSLEGITLKYKQWIQSWRGWDRCGRRGRAVKVCQGVLREVRFGTAWKAVKAGQRQEWWGQNRQGSRGLVSQGMLCLGAERLGKAVTVGCGLVVLVGVGHGSLGMARFGSAWLVTAWLGSQGAASCGSAWKGMSGRGAQTVTINLDSVVAVFGSAGLVSAGHGTAVMVWKSRLGKSGRCKDGRGPQKATINDGFSHGSEGLGSAGRGLEWQSRQGEERLVLSR